MANSSRTPSNCDSSFDIDPALVQGLFSVSGGASKVIGNKRTLVMDLCDENSDSEHSRYAESNRISGKKTTDAEEFDVEADERGHDSDGSIPSNVSLLCSTKHGYQSRLVTQDTEGDGSQNARNLIHNNSLDGAKENDGDDEDESDLRSKKKKAKKSRKIDQRSKKKKKSVDQWTSYKSKRPITVDLNLGEYNWDSFKLKMLEACEIEKAHVMMLLKAADALGELIFEGWINGSKSHKKSRHVEIKDNASFDDYVLESYVVSGRYDIGFKIIHPDPKERKKNKWERGESIVQMANPKDPGEFLLLNTARIRLWASDWEDKVLGVDEVNPPMNRPGWKWIPAALVTEEKARLMGHTASKKSPSTPDPTQPTIVHNNYYNTPLTTPLGNFPAHLQLANTPTSPCPPMLSGELSPPPGPSPSMHDFLSFTKIDRSKLNHTIETLSTAGVDRYEELLDHSAYSIDNLQDKVKLPYGHALIIFKAVPEFKQHLKRCFENQIEQNQ
ncbi:hypothetical protein DFH28DRAFT_934135 [Melampsora americana]|nr:hypothetical protein DFH28DRAFT_934135 [Melampsora americana]